MSKELIGKIRDELSDGGVIVSPYWAELFKESAEALETQAREIERLQLTCNDIDDQNDRIYAELAALKAQHEQDAQTIKVLQAMARHLKAQPSGVVLPERMTWDGLRATACNIRGEGWNACLDEVARLNQPASAGEPFKCDHAACVSLGEHHPFCEYVKQSIGGDDAERAAFEVCGVPVYQLQCREIGEGDWCPADLRHYTNCQKSPEMDTRIVEVRQARAALPVREAMAEGWKPAPVESTAEMEEAGCQAYMEADGTTCVMHNSSMRHAYKAMLAAAPSAGSHKEQGE